MKTLCPHCGLFFSSDLGYWGKDHNCYSLEIREQQTKAYLSRKRMFAKAEKSEA